MDDRVQGYLAHKKIPTPLGPPVYTNVRRFRGGLVSKARRLMFHWLESNTEEEEEAISKIR